MLGEATATNRKEIQQEGTTDSWFDEREERKCRGEGGGEKVGGAGPKAAGKVRNGKWRPTNEK